MYNIENQQRGDDVSENTMEVIFPTCDNCSAIIGDVWEEGRVTDAYQNNGFNFYAYVCPLCHTNQSLTIPIQGLVKECKKR